MSLAEAGEIFGYWEENPPAHLMLQAIARLLGWMPRPTPAGAPRINDLAAAAPPGLAVTKNGDLGMPAPLDADALRRRTGRGRLRSRGATGALSSVKFIVEHRPRRVSSARRSSAEVVRCGGSASAAS